jgi:Domain of unknown function (DUF5667)
VVERSRQHQLDRLIEEVACGRRDLASIRDERLREPVRLALRMHKHVPDVPDEYTRLRMRARVLAGLRPHAPTLRDHAWTALVLLARPAPYIVRGLALASVLVAMTLGASVASADSMPSDLLYPVKLASEDVRLTLAAAAGDRAAVELSIAEHRLAEAEQLATNGETSDTLVASAMYSQHVAWAAADLVAESAASDLGDQLESRFETQRDRIATLAVALSADTKSAAAAHILETIASPSVAEGTTGAQRVAETAAGVAQQLVRVAVQAESPANEPAASRAADPSAQPSVAPHATTASERRASEVTRQVRKAADEAKAAAAKTKSRR